VPELAPPSPFPTGTDTGHEERHMRHPPCALCEGLDSCRFLDCQEELPDGQALCWHCEAALAEDFAPDGPDDVFYRAPEPWGGRRPPLEPRQ